MRTPGDDARVVVTVGFLREVRQELTEKRRIVNAIRGLSRYFRTLLDAVDGQVEDHRIVRRINELTRSSDPDATPTDPIRRDTAIGLGAVRESNATNRRDRRSD